MRWALTVGLALSVAVTALATAPARAADGQYIVLKCHAYSRSAEEVQAETAAPYVTADRCGGTDFRLEVTVNGYGTAGQAGLVRYTAPTDTSIVGVTLDANLRRANHHLAQLAVVNDDGTYKILAQGDDQGDGYTTYSFTGLNARRFVVQLVCSDGGGCPNTAVAHAYARNIGLVMADRVDPAVSVVGGTMLDGGWRRGSEALQGAATDSGAGLSTISAAVNGAEIARVEASCLGTLGSVGLRLAPCPVSPRMTTVDAFVDTANNPFLNGPNQVEFCARDFAGNDGACVVKTVLVDNAPPTLSFLPQDPEDPELIRVAAAEPHSGLDPERAAVEYRQAGTTGPWIRVIPTQVRDGSLIARIDSGETSPGQYEFRATAADNVGNYGETTQRANGDRMVLTFPLRQPVQLVARVGDSDSRHETIGYGKPSKARGRLLDRNGEPMVGRQITIAEYFGSGALIDRRIRTVATDERGRWSSLLPAGPSRTVTAAFAGTPQFQPSQVLPGELRVRSRASLAVSDDRIGEGRAVEFTGKVGHVGAHVPAGGKLVELQVREGRARWNTVREAFHTDSSGRFRLRYRFGRFYETDAEFVFRVKVAREQYWPYKAPGRSPARTVTVVANR